ncbi:MAG TPA: peptidoglycan-binding protein [Ilumatobacteraceae bacterium]|nr:peptidoglycan-binding protein [Ilumatobacteraceae bacterium]
MRRSKTNRAVGALIATAVIIAGCSGSDDDDTSPTTQGPSPETTEAGPETTEAGLNGEGLDLGLLAPSPGLLATLFQGQVRGSGFAVDDVNEGGGVLEGPLTVTNSVAEPGAEPTANVQAAVDAGAQALIGPPGSADVIDVRDEIASLDSTACSASASLPGATLGQDQLALVRTVLPDDVTSTYLATNIIARRDEVAPGVAWKVAIVARSDAYGQSIGNSLAAILQSAGLEPSVIGYNPRRVTFAGTAQEVAALQPDLSILVTYEEGANLLSALVTAGVDPATMIGLDAFFQPRIADLATAGTDASAVDGFQALGSMGNKAFLERLYDDDSNGQVANAAQAYDCAVMLSLATAAVETGDADSIGQALIDVTGDGVTCTTYADCLEKLNAGENINYDGVSGQIQLDENGDPTFARFTTARLEGGVAAGIQSTDVNIADIRRQQEAYASAALYTQIQQALTFLGFYTGPINGINTPETQAALAAFQTSVGLPPTGVWDEATAAAMTAALGEYSSLLTSTTADIQRLLTDLGFYTGPIDGIWSQEVTDAIKALQRDLGVPETGVLDAATLQAAYARGVETGSATTTTQPPATTVPPTTAAPAPETTAPPAPGTTAPPVTAPPTTAPPAPETTAPPTTVPSEPLGTLLEELTKAGTYDTLVEIVESARSLLSEVLLPYPYRYTVVAPQDGAFTPEFVTELLGDQVAAEQFVLSLMIDNGGLALAELPNPSYSLGALGVELAVSGTTIGGATVVDPDRPAINGVIHGVSTLPVATS